MTAASKPRGAASIPRVEDVPREEGPSEKGTIVLGYDGGKAMTGKRPMS